MATPQVATSQARVAPPALEIQGLVAGYQQLQVLHGLNLRVPTGTLTALVGPNGGGKSTLFRCILGLLSPSTGSILVLGQPASLVRRALGYVPQRELVDWRFPVTVSDVVLMGRYGKLGLLRRPTRLDRDLALRCLDEVGMLELADRQIGELSGGQQQRVFLARALVQEPDMLLLDEPMAGVDAVTEQDIFALLDRLRGQGKTVLMATHDLSCVAEKFDRVIFINGWVVAEGPPREVFTEANLKAAYGAHVVLVKVGERYFAVDAGAHH